MYAQEVTQGVCWLWRGASSPGPRRAWWASGVWSPGSEQHLAQLGAPRSCPECPVPHPGLSFSPSMFALLCLIFPPALLSPGSRGVAHLCPRLCSGPGSAQRLGGHGPGAAGGAAGSLPAAPSPGSSRPGAGLWGPARRPSASWGWCLRWSGGVDRPAGQGQRPAPSGPGLSCPISPR